MIEQALQHLKSGNYAAAEVLYRQMLADEPENPEVLYMLALTRQGQNDLNTPLELLSKALRVQPKNPTLHHTLGMIQLQGRKFNEAERSFYACVAIDPNFAAALNGIAAVELARGRYAAAEQVLRKAMRAEPDNLQVLLNMGIAMLEQGRGEDAISYLQQVAGQQEDNYFALFHLGRAFMVAGNAGFAAGAFEKASRVQPNAAEALILLAAAQSQSHQHEAAAKSYRQALDLGVENAQTLGGMARALAALQRYRESEGAYLRALRLSAGEEQELLLLDFADDLLLQRRYGEVIQRLQQRLDQAHDPTHNPVQDQVHDLARMTRILAEARLGRGDAVAARELLRPLLATGAPDDAARLLLVRALRQTGEKEAAAAQLNRLLQSDQPPIDAILFNAAEQLAEGNLANAIEGLRSVQRRHDLSHAHRQLAVKLLADALHRDGQYQSAWEQYLGLDPKQADVMTLQSEKALQLQENQPATTAMDREVAWSWPPQPVDDGRPEPVFVVAWPGMGQQRLLQALAAHSQIQVIQDELAAQRERRLVISYPQGRDPLNALSAAQIQLARRKYWKGLQRAATQAAAYTDAAVLRYIDGMVLTVEALPTIYRLFPQAHVIVMQADPRDLAVSWLQSSYRDPEAMARRYAQQAALLQRCQAGVPLKYVEVDSHRLATEAGTSLRELISALGLAWEAQVEQAFHESGFALPEFGSWRNYQSFMQPVFRAFDQISVSAPAIRQSQQLT